MQQRPEVRADSIITFTDRVGEERRGGERPPGYSVLTWARLAGLVPALPAPESCLTEVINDRCTPDGRTDSVAL